MISDTESELIESLEELFELEGILGAIVCTNSAEIVASKTSTIYDENSIGVIVKKLSRTLSSIKDLRMKFETVKVSFEGGTVILKDLRRGFLCIILSGTEISPLMEMSFSMVKKKVVRLFTFKKAAPASPPASPPENHIEVEAPLEEAEQTVPAEKIKLLNEELCRYLGPAGGVIIKKKSKKLGFSWNKLPISYLDNFLKAVEAMIDSDKDSEAFKKYNSNLFKEYL